MTTGLNRLISDAAPMSIVPATKPAANTIPMVSCIAWRMLPNPFVDRR
jgi:hypothetical protein